MVGNKGPDWIELFLRAGNKNLPQVVVFLEVGNMDPEVLILKWFQVEKKPLKNGQKIHSLLDVGCGEADYTDHLTDYEENYPQVLVSKEAFRKCQQTIALMPVTWIHKDPERMVEGARES